MAEDSVSRKTTRPAKATVGLRESREFFDQLFTQVVRTRFRAAAGESSRRRMNIVVGHCTSARCQLTANGYRMVVAASGMLTPAPEIWLVLSGPGRAGREPLCTRLRFSSEAAWVAIPHDEPVGDLTVWIESGIAFFLDWVAEETR